ncbi:MAG: hypothetical protein GX605_06125 [Chloroflexi bacterium]|nr:hypothetical protein [Chloroflexota bacterium]
MAQSTAGTNLAATAAAAGRKPACQVVVDWTRAGWGSEGAWVDETAYVRSLQLDQRAADLRGKGVAILGNSAAATGQVALDNSTGRFSPHNTGGALYPYIRDGLMVGVPVRIYLGFHHGATPERLVQFSGYIAEPSLQARGGVVTLRLRDRAWDLEQGRHSSVLYMPGTPEGYSGYPDAYIGSCWS